jgi:hypothetical protein
VSDDESDAMRTAVVAILKQYNARLETGDADDVATLESLAAAIGPASELNLSFCKEFVEYATCRVGVFNAALRGAGRSSDATGSAVRVPASSAVLPGEA